jgi:hypothetical protein
MRWFALAVFVWLLAFLACLGALLMSPQEDEVGEIAVEHSAYCDQFVVKTKQGYVTLIDMTGNLVAIAGARQISGRLYTKGVQRFTLDGRTEVMAVVRHFDTQWLTARSRLDAECPQSVAEELKN